jgi:hypothetical protein
VIAHCFGQPRISRWIGGCRHPLRRRLKARTGQMPVISIIRESRPARRGGRGEVGSGRSRSVNHHFVRWILRSPHSTAVGSLSRAPVTRIERLRHLTVLPVESGPPVVHAAASVGARLVTLVEGKVEELFSFHVCSVRELTVD